MPGRHEHMAATETENPGLVGREVWLAANELITLHGGHAPLYAMQSVGLSIERGDFGGATQWRLVWRATKELLRRNPTSPHGPH